MTIYSSSKHISSIDEIAFEPSARFPYEVNLDEAGCDLRVYTFETWRDAVSFKRGFEAALTNDKTQHALCLTATQGAIFIALHCDSSDTAVQVEDHADLKYE